MGNGVPEKSLIYGESYSGAEIAKIASMALRQRGENEADKPSVGGPGLADGRK